MQTGRINAKDGTMCKSVPINAIDGTDAANHSKYKEKSS